METSPAPGFKMFQAMLLAGSGVSILRVNSFNPGDYARMGGTGCGGGQSLNIFKFAFMVDPWLHCLFLPI